MLKRFKLWVARLMADVIALWFSYRNPKTPLAAKILAAIVVAYAFSPIDLIPDFIPLLGYLDDALLLPLGIWLAIRLIPAPVLELCRAQARRWLADPRPKPTSRYGAVAIIALWVVLLWLAWQWMEPRVA